METPRSNGTDKIPFSPNAATMMGKVGLAVLMILQVAGCAPDGFKTQGRARDFLAAEGATAKAMCNDRAALVAHVFEKGEGIPKPGTDLTYMGKKAIAEAPVAVAVDEFCGPKEEEK